MPSSTSSSDRAGGRGGLGALLLAALLFAGAFGALELGWRARGHGPSVVDDLALWAQERARIGCERGLEGDDRIALLGASRMLLDVSPRALRRALPDREPVQLAVGGAWPVATLRDLAADPAFRGVVIVSANAEALERAHWDDQREYVGYYHREWRPERALDRRLKTALEVRLAAVNPSLGLQSLGRALLDRGALPEPFFLVTHADRSKSADYGRVDFTRNLRLGDRVVRSHYRSARITPPERWRADAATLEAEVQRIHARGGRVAFVRLPTGGVHWREEQRHYPRAAYWDAFAAGTGAVALHFRDDPALAAFVPPDGSHLDGRDAPAFTAALAAALAERGLFDPPGRPPSR